MSIKKRLEALEAKIKADTQMVKRHFTNGVLTDSKADLLVTCIGSNKQPLNGWHNVPIDKVLEIDIV